jgi:hypothetical protein
MFILLKKIKKKEREKKMVFYSYAHMKFIFIDENGNVTRFIELKKYSSRAWISYLVTILPIT